MHHRVFGPLLNIMWEGVRALPVFDFRALPEHELLVFSDFTGLAAYGSNGLVWRSPRVWWDDLKITNVTHETIEGTGLQEMRFAVDLKTGHALLRIERHAQF